MSLPDIALAHAHRLQLDGHLAEADTAYRAILGPAGVEALHNLGLLRFQQGNLTEALPLIEAAHRLAPTARSAHNLATILARQGRTADAIAWENGAIAAEPDYILSWFALADMLIASGDTEGAVGKLLEFAERAIRAGDPPPIEQAIERLITLNTDHANLLRVATLLRMAGWETLAARLLDVKLRTAPDHIAAHLSLAMCHLTRVHADETEIERRRAAYATALADVADRTARAPAAALRASANVIGMAQPFLLAYHCRNDRDLQGTLGGIVSRLVSADEFTPAPRPPPPRAGERIRVGFASAFLHQHSVAKTHGSWIEQLDRQRFAVFGYQLSEARDATSERIAASCDAYRRGVADVAGWRDCILADAPHVMIYLDIGLEQTAPRLAARRLAPVQCTTWGHPVTSGLPTVDCYLSSAAMEPPDGDAQYTERLIRLPNLGIYYTPRPASGELLERKDLGLRETSVVYLCCQSLFKYQPRHDALFAQIAARVADSQFLFLTQNAGAADTIFRGRLERAFAAVDLDWRAHCVLTPQVEPALFASLLRCGDVFLDSLGWSGCNSTLEAICCDLPIVTMAGDSMRGRHSAAILACMGLEHWVAPDLVGYVELAAHMARPADRAGFRALLQARRDRLFNDPAPMRALEDFLTQAVAEAYATPGVREAAA